MTPEAQHRERKPAPLRAAREGAGPRRGGGGAAPGAGPCADLVSDQGVVSKCINPVRKGRVNSTIRQWTEGLDGRAPEGGPCENSREAREDAPDATGQQDEATGSALTGRFAPRAWRVRAPADPCIGEDTGGRSPPGFSGPRRPEPLGLQSGRGVSSLDPPASPATSAAWGLRGGVGLRAPVPAFPTRGSSSRGLRAMGTLDGSSCSVGCQRRTTRHTRRPSPGPEEDGSCVHSRPALAGPPPHSPTRKGLEGAGRMQSGQPTPALEGKALPRFGLEDGEPKCACSEACVRPPRSGAAPSGPLSSAAALLRAAFLLLEASRPDLPSEGRLKSSEGL